MHMPDTANYASEEAEIDRIASKYLQYDLKETGVRTNPQPAFQAGDLWNYPTQAAPSSNLGHFGAKDTVPPAVGSQNQWRQPSTVDYADSEGYNSQNSYQPTTLVPSALTRKERTSTNPLEEAAAFIAKVEQ